MSNYQMQRCLREFIGFLMIFIFGISIYANDDNLYLSSNEQPSNIPYTIYSTKERLGKIIIYYSEEMMGTQYLIWDDGYIARRDPGKNSYALSKIDIVQVKNVINAIKIHYEQGAKDLDGQRIPFPFISFGTGAHATMQIMDQKYFQDDCWSYFIVKRFEREGLDSLNGPVEDIKKIFPFNIPNQGLEARYRPDYKGMDEPLTKKEMSLMAKRFKEDIKHLLYCKNKIKSLFPDNIPNSQMLELTVVASDPKNALRYGEKISTYKYVYENEAYNEVKK